MSNNQLKSIHSSLSPDFLGYIAIALSLFLPPLAIFVAVEARLRARATGARSWPADLGYFLSIFLTVLLTLFVVVGFLTSVVMPLLGSI